jgi:hypothetical protein
VESFLTRELTRIREPRDRGEEQRSLILELAALYLQRKGEEWARAAISPLLDELQAAPSKFEATGFEQTTKTTTVGAEESGPRRRLCYTTHRLVQTLVASLPACPLEVRRVLQVLDERLQQQQGKPAGGFEVTRLRACGRVVLGRIFAPLVLEREAGQPPEVRHVLGKLARRLRKLAEAREDSHDPVQRQNAPLLRGFLTGLLAPLPPLRSAWAPRLSFDLARAGQVFLALDRHLDRVLEIVRPAGEDEAYQCRRRLRSDMKLLRYLASRLPPEKLFPPDAVLPSFLQPGPRGAARWPAGELVADALRRLLRMMHEVAAPALELREAQLPALRELAARPITAALRELADPALAGELAQAGTPAQERRRLVFFLNLFNLLTALAHIRHGPPPEPGASTRAVWARQTKVCLAACNVSLLELEQQLLRQNLPSSPPGGWPGARSLPLAPLREPDLRLGFALALGTRSAPTLRCYSSEALEDELDAAAREYLERLVRAEPAEQPRELVLPQLLEWYAPDFGGHTENVLLWLRKHFLASARLRLLLPTLDALLQDPTSVRMHYEPFSWEFCYILRTTP